MYTVNFVLKKVIGFVLWISKYNLIKHGQENCHQRRLLRAGERDLDQEYRSHLKPQRPPLRYSGDLLRLFGERIVDLGDEEEV